MSKSIETKTLSTVIRVILFLCFGVGVVVCIYIISQGKMTDREAAMLGLLVTILSVLASWIITEMYSTAQYREAIQEVREEHRNNLRTYALKAAEKVNNLSNELNKLSIYLEEELNYTDYRSPDEELLAKEERIESAIHLVRTLKSVNDTGLSDWEGVIGEELDQRREEQEEKEEALRHLITRVESLIEGQQIVVGTRLDTSSVREEVEGLKRELRLATFQLSDATIPKRILRKEPKQDISTDCPVCEAKLVYKQRSSVRSVKLVPCKACGTKLVSQYTQAGGFSLVPRGQEPVAATCPHCTTTSEILLDNLPGSSAIASCPSCSKSFRLSRSHAGVEITAVNSATAVSGGSVAAALTEQVIETVRQALPPQPWPTGTHLIIAKDHQLQASQVRRAMSELIKRGVCHHQVDGVIYEPL
jgi:hypothetical protein